MEDEKYESTLKLELEAGPYANRLAQSIRTIAFRHDLEVITDEVTKIGWFRRKIRMKLGGDGDNVERAAKEIRELLDEIGQIVNSNDELD